MEIKIKKPRGRQKQSKLGSKVVTICMPVATFNSKVVQGLIAKHLLSKTVSQYLEKLIKNSS